MQEKTAGAVEDCFEVASKVFNDSSWVPSTIAMPDLCPELAVSRQLPLKEYRTTRDKIKEKYDLMKNKLHVMIGNWERSGNGGMQRDDSVADWGHFDLDNVVDGDNRINFLPQSEDGRTSTAHCLVHFWERLDKEGHIQFTLAKLPEWIKANAHVFSLVAADRKAKEREKDKSRSELAASIKVVGEAIQSQANQSVLRHIDVLERQLFDVDLKLVELEPEGRAHELCSKCKAKLEKDIQEARKRVKPAPTEAGSS